MAAICHFPPVGVFPVSCRLDVGCSCNIIYENDVNMMEGNHTLDSKTGTYVLKRCAAIDDAAYWQGTTANIVE